LLLDVFGRIPRPSRDDVDIIVRDIGISMDGKGRWRDNVFVERIWRSIKYEEVYLHAYASVCEARQSIGRYIDFYNTTRPHSSLKAQTPDQVYFNRLPESTAA
jgi:putative transposase